jgi:ABC-type antimicrobial peptide transport system permease subunit
VKDTPASPGTEPAFWWPIAQAPFSPQEFSIVMAGEADVASITHHLRAAVRELDPDLAVADIRPMEKVADRSYAAARFALFLIGLFAVLALTLAAIGTYGIISYSVNQRNHEFGVRMALGASSSGVLTSVLSEGMRLAVAGTVTGVVCGLAVGRLLASLLYGVRVSDPMTIGTACLVMILASALACFVPARRATRSDPMQALRTD